MTQPILRVTRHSHLHAGSPYQHMEEPVTVYSFEVWDQTRGAYVAQRLKSPAWRIERIGRARIIPDSAEEIEASMLDPQGRYNP